MFQDRRRGTNTARPAGWCTVFGGRPEKWPEQQWPCGAVWHSRRSVSAKYWYTKHLTSPQIGQHDTTSSARRRIELQLQRPGLPNHQHGSSSNWQMNWTSGALFVWRPVQSFTGLSSVIMLYCHVHADVSTPATSHNDCTIYTYLATRYCFRLTSAVRLWRGWDADFQSRPGGRQSRQPPTGPHRTPGEQLRQPRGWEEHGLLPTVRSWHCRAAYRLYSGRYCLYTAVAKLATSGALSYWVTWPISNGARAWCLVLSKSGPWRRHFFSDSDSDSGPTKSTQTPA